MKTIQKRTGLFMLFFSLVVLSYAPIHVSATESPFETGKKHYDAKEYEKAHPFFVKAAEKGNVEAMTHLGKMYYNGWGIKHNHQTGKEWHEKAAKLGSEESQQKLENMKHKEKGKDKH